jgi:agmatine deiminase
MTIRIPAEWEPHACCWMAWAVHREWGKTVTQVKSELSEVIQTIAQYEPVRLLAPRGSASREARREVSSCSGITVIAAPVDDIWMRDIALTFAFRGGGHDQKVVAIDWNFNGWGGTQGRLIRSRHRIEMPRGLRPQATVVVLLYDGHNYLQCVMSPEIRNTR